MSVMDRAIRWSLTNRLVVVVAAAAITLYGALTAARMPIDVFPDLTAPSVTVVTEAHGLAPEEVESLVTVPIETAVNGATNVRRVRSSSGIGLSVVWVEFDWGTDVMVARQVVGEKLQLVAGQLPPEVAAPALAPVSSIMGEIAFIAVTSPPGAHAPIDVRATADWIVRKRLLAVPGVAQVIAIGGGVKKLNVIVEPERLLQYDLTMEEVEAALREANLSASGGFLGRGPQAPLIRGLGRATSPEDFTGTVIERRDGVPITVGHVAHAELGPGLRLGEGSANAQPAVVMAIQKQPGANTIALTGRLDRELDAISATLPEGMVIERQLFRQSDFIATAVENVAVSLRDGAILVAVILFLFLLNARATLISLAALPVSLLVAVLAMRALGATINTMTLGGLTIAIGALVDDAIIDVENVFRRLRENRLLPAGEQRPALDVVYEASREVRGSIVFATLIVMLVFVPLFFLSGIEGRLLAPLGFAYLVGIFASLVVALTLTPALCALLLSRREDLTLRESFLVRWLKTGYRRLLAGVLRHTSAVVVTAVLLLGGAVALLSSFGTSFLPEFNEGALTISAVAPPGTSLDETDRLGRRLEKILLGVPEVVSTARRTGRAELDEHAQDVSASEIEVKLRRGSRSREAFLADLRARLAVVPGVAITVGQPLSHRIDHMLSGTRASIAVKLFGDDLTLMREHAERIRRVMAEVPGAVDVSIEQQPDVPQLAIAFDRERIARFGMRAGALAEHVEASYSGHVVTQLLDNQRTTDVVVRYGDEHRRDAQAVAGTLIDTPDGALVPLGLVADIRRDVGPNTISRENVQRKMVIMANVSGRDLGGVIADMRAGIARDVPLPPGYYVVYGGQFESQRAATRTIGLLGVLVVGGIFLLLYLAFASVGRALLVMVNLPLALIGGVAAAWLGGGVLTVGSLVGFVTLFGIATRNGIMMLAHYEHLQRHEGASFDDAVVRGSLERLSPILMTALCAGLALVPLVLAGHEPGNEIQAPMGVVILGGLLSSTGLNMIVVPALYHRFFRPAAA